MFDAHVVQQQPTQLTQPPVQPLINPHESDKLNQLVTDCREASRSDESTQSSSPLSNASNWSKDSAIQRAQYVKQHGYNSNLIDVAIRLLLNPSVEHLHEMIVIHDIC